MTQESTAAEVFVSQPFSSMYFFPPPPTKEISLGCLGSFLKDSPGQSFQERNLIYFGTRGKKKKTARNVKRAMGVSFECTANIINKRTFCDAVCSDAANTTNH